MVIQNLAFYRYLIRSIQCNGFHITKSWIIRTPFTTGNRVIIALNLPIIENPELIQKTHSSDSVPLTSLICISQGSTKEVEPVGEI